MAQAYCVKCRAKRDMQDAKEVAMRGKGGQERRAMTGTCSVCGTKMFKILGKAEAEAKKAA
ncbi:MAG: DUF5679 domain-containing protein [Patescibacteria group bacterium]